jgi:hypothetical protein
MGKKLPHNQTKQGFTTIEIILFIAISAALIVGLMLGVTASVARQRYQDSVQDLADWLKTQYLAVSNPVIQPWDSAELLDYRTWNGTEISSFTATDARRRKGCGFTNVFTNIEGEDLPAGRGQSNCQLYGMLIVFGEPIGGQTDSNLVTTYLVLGIDDLRQSMNEYGVRQPMAPSGLSTQLTGEPFNDLMVSDIFIPALRLSDDYTLQYGAEAQAIDGSPLRAAILIVRPPRSGAVRTIVLHESIAVTDIWNGLRSSGSDPARAFFPDDMFTNPTRFQTTGDIDICVASDDVGAAGGMRRNIRITAGSGNASAVELVAANEGVCGE